jgi:hypothetical protein
MVSYKINEAYVSITNKTDNHDITEILLKVAVNTITLSNFNVNRILYHTCVVNYEKEITLHNKTNSLISYERGVM